MSDPNNGSCGGINNPDGDSDKSSNSSKEEKPKEPKTWWKRVKIWTLVIVLVPAVIGVIYAVMQYPLLNDNRDYNRDIRDYTKQQTDHSTRNLCINEDLKGYSKDNTETNKQRLEVQRKTLHNNVEIEQEQLIDNANRAATQVLKTSFPCPADVFDRSSLQQDNETIQNYIERFDASNPDKAGFLLAVGVEAAGRTTLFRQILCNMKCVIPIKDTISPGTVLNKDWLMMIVLKHLRVSKYSDKIDLEMDFLKNLSTWCTETHGNQLVIYADLGIDEEEGFTWKTANHIGHKIGTFGRLITYDFPIVPFVVETSISQISDAITREHGDICEKVHVPRMNLEEFAISYALKYDNRFDGIIGEPKATISVPLGENVPNYTAALEDWYYRLGSNLRDLEDVLKGLEESQGGREVFDRGMSLCALFNWDWPSVEWQQ